MQRGAINRQRSVAIDRDRCVPGSVFIAKPYVAKRFRSEQPDMPVVYMLAQAASTALVAMAIL